MKKIILAAAIVCAAVVTHAAAVGWTCMGASTFSGGTYDVFVIGINGVTGVDQIKTLVAAGGLDAASSYAFYADGSVTTVASLGQTASGKSITWSGSGTDTYSGFIFLENAVGDSASYTSEASISLANDSTGKTFLFGNQSSNIAANTFSVGAVPEPTSGLLLLLGMAGLALKRKIA